MNNIYLQWTGAAPLYIHKLIFDAETPYALGSDGHTITRYYYITGDSCSVFGSYSSTKSISDFVAQDYYVYLASYTQGLEIINFQSDVPFLYSSLAINDSIYYVHLVNNNLYIFGKYNFYIIDVSDKQSPKKISEYAFEYRVVYSDIDSIYAYILALDNNFYILDIKNPYNLQLKLHYKGDTTAVLSKFIINKNYVYFLQIYGWIDVYEIIKGNLSYISRLNAESSISFITKCEKYGLAVSDGAIYLLNVEFPSRPCICEKMKIPSYGYLNYGVILDKTIYVIDAYWLHFIQIRDIPQ